MAAHDKSEEYCYPTKCPKCGKDVFRGLYNGGIYWVESLGDPWPNHPCFRSAVRKKRIDWRKIFDDHHQRELDRILGASATKAQPVSTPRKQSPMVATAAWPIVEKPSKESKPLFRPRIFELVGIDGKRKPLERQELSGMPVRKLAGANNVPTPWGVSMMEVFKNKGLAVPGVSAEGFLIVRFRRGSVAEN